MRILIFDRKIETLNFLHEKFNSENHKITIAENGSKFMAYLLSQEKAQFDAIIVCRKEMLHYGINEAFFYKRALNPILICSYLHCDDYHIKEIEISSLEFETYKDISKKASIKRILKLCETEEVFDETFIYKLPKKSGLLLKHLAMNENTGLSDEEIARLFWGKSHASKKHCIYNHVYNLRKYLKSEFKDSYIIHKEANRYKLIKLTKEA